MSGRRENGNVANPDNYREHDHFPNEVSSKRGFFRRKSKCKQALKLTPSRGIATGPAAPFTWQSSSSQILYFKLANNPKVLSLRRFSGGLSFLAENTHQKNLKITKSA